MTIWQALLILGLASMLTSVITASFGAGYHYVIHRAPHKLDVISVLSMIGGWVLVLLGICWGMLEQWLA